MAQHVLRGCHSYALIKPSGREKIVIKRGQTIENLSDEDRNYLATKTVTPPMMDDSHPAMGRLPVFTPVLDADVKGEASIEEISVPAAPSQPYAGQAQVETEVVTVQVTAAPAVTKTVTDGDAARGSNDVPDATATVRRKKKADA